MVVQREMKWKEVYKVWHLSEHGHDNVWHELWNAEALSILCKHENVKLVDYTASSVQGISAQGKENRRQWIEEDQDGDPWS